MWRVVRGMDICVDPVGEEDHHVMVAVLPTDESWGAGVSLAVTDDPMVLPPDLAALTVGLGGSVVASEQPPLALLAAPQVAERAEPTPWAESIVDALAALPAQALGWAPPAEGVAAAADAPRVLIEPSPSQSRPPQLAARENRENNDWLWSVNRPIPLWSGPGDVQVQDAPERANDQVMTLMAALPMPPDAFVPATRPAAKPESAGLARPASRSAPVTTADVKAPSAGEPTTERPRLAAVRVQAEVEPRPAAAEPLIVYSPNRQPRSQTPSVVYGRLQLAALTPCAAFGPIAECAIDDPSTPWERSPASARRARPPHNCEPPPSLAARTRYPQDFHQLGVRARNGARPLAQSLMPLGPASLRRRRRRPDCRGI